MELPSFEMPDFSSYADEASNLMNSARDLGTKAVAKADAATSIFTTSAKDKLAAVDGFGKDAAEVLTEAKTTLTSKVNEAKKWLTNTKIANMGSLNDMLDKASSLKKDAEKLQSQITGIVSDGIGSVRGLTNDILGPAEDALWKLQQVPFDKITDGKYWMHIATGGSLDELNDLGNIATRFLGRVDRISDGFKDTYAEASLALGIGTKAADLGYAPIVGTVMDQYGHLPDVREALIAKFPDAIAQGNTDLVKTIIEKFGKDYVLVKYPNAVEMIITSYRMPIGAEINDFPKLGQELDGILKSLNPTWSKPISVPNAVHNLRVFSGASAGAERVLSTIPELMYLVRTATHYSRTDVLSLASTTYPLVVFKR